MTRHSGAEAAAFAVPSLSDPLNGRAEIPIAQPERLRYALGSPIRSSSWHFPEAHMLPDGPRKPLQATLTGTPIERRRDRVHLAPCATCGHDTHLRVMLRTPYFLYVRCESCIVLWTVPKPGNELFGT